MGPEVLCIGHAAYDLSVFVSKFPVENSKYETQELREAGGGPAANAAFLLATWGMPVAFAGLVGADDSGQRVRAELATAGVELSLLELRPGHATPFSVILVNRQNGSRTIVNRKVPGQYLKLTPEQFAPFRPKVLLFDGHELEASLAALRAFPEAISILDAGSRRDGTARLAGRVNYLAASERFARQTTGLPDLGDEDAQRACVEDLRNKYGAKVVVTLGERGLVADAGDGFQYLPAYPARTVDTTAAGDIFHGAFAYAVAKGLPFGEGLRLSARAAAFSVESPGGRSSIPPLEKVRAAL
jgi:sugar/nucleoside kinase (ribokinase family)